jgi:hypothetical protein
MEPSNIITLSQLRAWGACRPACERFRREFGDKLYVTRDYVREYCHEFNITWLMWHSLSRTDLAQLYERVPKPVLADCTDIGVVVQKYHEALALAWFDLWSDPTNREERTPNGEHDAR